MKRGEIWWARIPVPSVSEPGYRRPVVIVSADAYNRSGISTVLAAAITANLGRESAPGNVRLAKRDSGLPRPSVVNITQLMTLDKRMLGEKVKRLPPAVLAKIDTGLLQALSLPR
ncbi:type II toxin-antitoxin system PemK/MazF family toxin [bacterium]|nr:type II toxin-antitoxin system PemK/MazF family toxin [bacterium]